MQNVGQSENRNIDKVKLQLDVVKSSTPHSSASSPAKSESETYSGAPAKYMTDSSESEDDSVSEAEMDEEGGGAEVPKFILEHDSERVVDPEMQARLEALLEAAGIGKLSGDGKHLADPERPAARAPPTPPPGQAYPMRVNGYGDNAVTVAPPVGADGAPSLAEACSDGDVGTVRKLLTEGRSVHETTEEGESLLSLACSAGYYELAQVLLAMHASVEDRGIKLIFMKCPEGHEEMVALLLGQGASINAQTDETQETALTLACCGGFLEVADFLIKAGADAELGASTPLMEASSGGPALDARAVLVRVSRGAQVPGERGRGRARADADGRHGAHVRVRERAHRRGRAAAAGRRAPRARERGRPHAAHEGLPRRPRVHRAVPAGQGEQTPVYTLCAVPGSVTHLLLPSHSSVSNELLTEH
ncbi:hypothetical protein ACJJTC_014770 [Scirpophaga incertulas]